MTYLGRIAETGDMATVCVQPAHPCTRAPLSAVPLPGPAAERARERITLLGDPPRPASPPPGCSFPSRCHRAQEICRVERPLPRPAGPGRRRAAGQFPETGPPG